MTQFEFQSSETFGALHEAQLFCRLKGYSCGSLSGDSPVALIKGDDFLVAKWKNLTGKERAFVDGTITSPDFRKGPVLVKLFRES